MSIRRPPLAGLLAVALVCGGLFVGGAAAAQSIQGEPTDLRFAVVNATTGEPGRIDRLTIDYVLHRPNGILDMKPSASEFTAPGVPIKDVGEYIITAWSGGVPYWWSRRGRDLMTDVTTLHVFDTTRDLADVTISGLNVVVRRQESLLNLELMLQVQNAASPQVTVFDRDATLRLAFPAGAASIAAEYRRGPDPTPIPASLSGAHLDLAVPLTPGANRVRVTAAVPWAENMEIPVGADVPVEAWSLLASPAGLQIKAMELETSDEEVPGYARFTGPELSADRTFDLRLASGEAEAAPAGDLFTTAAPGAGAADRDAAAADGGGGGFPLPFVFAGVLIIIVIVAAVRRRG